jgi:hypothetical protein
MGEQRERQIRKLAEKRFIFFYPSSVDFHFKTLENEVNKIIFREF